MSNPLPSGLLDWGNLTPLRLQAQRLADGLYTGPHRSQRRGSGVEFYGHRDYTPGDDLRRLDHRALMRHGRLLVRQFETDTERRLCLVLDGTLSMAYRSSSAPAAKLAYASLLAAALGRVAVASGDLMSLDWLGAQAPTTLPAHGGKEAFERLVIALEGVEPGGDARLDDAELETALGTVARRARRGSVVMLFSDLLDLPGRASQSFAALSNRHRLALGIRVLDPVEARFPFEGPVRLRGSFGGTVIETDATQARAGYLAALEAQRQSWEAALAQQGGRLVTCSTDEPAIDVLRRILRAVEGDAR